MIPQPYITEWSTHAPWPTESQIEQDLIPSRLILEIASDASSRAGGAGARNVRTFRAEEVLATKLRALYTRRKGCDLYDLWLALTDLELDDQLIVDGLAQLSNPEFLDDIHNLARDLHGYEHRTAAELLMHRLGMRLRNAPAERPPCIFWVTCDRGDR